jgi:hypothetical protein
MGAGADAAQRNRAVRVRRGDITGRRELRCAGCGYGVSVTGEPPPCPMCGGMLWDPAPWRPFTALAAPAGLEARSGSDRPR